MTEVILGGHASIYLPLSVMIKTKVVFLFIFFRGKKLFPLGTVFF